MSIKKGYTPRFKFQVVMETFKSSKPIGQIAKSLVDNPDKVQVSQLDGEQSFKQILTFILIVPLIFWSCATYQPPPPSQYMGELPPSAIADLSLDDRILVEDAWRYIQDGRAKKAEEIINKLGSQNSFYYVG